MRTKYIKIYGGKLSLRAIIVDPTTVCVHLPGPVEPLVLRKVGGKWTIPGRAPTIARTAIVKAWESMAGEIGTLTTSGKRRGEQDGSVQNTTVADQDFGRTDAGTSTARGCR